MSTFTNFNTALKLEYLKDYSIIKNQDYWKVIDGFTYYSEILGNQGKLWVKVPDGFYTDGATIPKVFWSWLPPLSQYGQAAVLHDYLRKTLKAYLDEQYDNPIKCIDLSIKDTDNIFLEAMTVLEVPKYKCYIMYYAVRTFAIVKGWFS